MGRRPKWTNGGETIAVYISKDQAAFIRRAAEELGVSKSEIVRRAINKYFFLPENATDGRGIGYQR
jgi:hypothetical protein